MPSASGSICLVADEDEARRGRDLQPPAKSSFALWACAIVAVSLALAIAVAAAAVFCLPCFLGLRGHHDAEQNAPGRTLNISSAEPSLRSVPGGFSLMRLKVAPGRQERYWDWTPLRVEPFYANLAGGKNAEAGNRRVRFITSEGTYVSEHVDGNLSAYAPDTEPSTVFEEEVLQRNDTIAFKSQMGSYLRVNQDGFLTAGGDAAGASETFTKVRRGAHGRHVFLESQGRMVAAVNTRLTLLTTSFVPTWDNYHLHEIYSALITNILNKAIYDVHVVTETDCTLLRNTLLNWGTNINANITRFADALHRKLVCVPSPTGVQPRYKDFFIYANESLTGRLVLLSNADIVFDDTLRRIIPDRIQTGEMAFILSVSPPAPGARYKEIFGKDCWPTPKCAVGKWQGAPDWKSAGWSWDAYVFGSPLPSKFDPWQVDVVMNMMGAEYIAAYQFEATGVKLYNPCQHVHTYHWHCQGGKMHGARDWKRRQAVANIYPCSYCPGITMPDDYAKQEDLCKSGFLEWNNAIPTYFKMPDISARVCCASQSACGGLDLSATPGCRGPDDVNCIIWEFVGKHTIFTHG